MTRRSPRRGKVGDLCGILSVPVPQLASELNAGHTHAVRVIVAANISKTVSYLADQECKAVQAWKSYCDKLRIK